MKTLIIIVHIFFGVLAHCKTLGHEHGGHALSSMRRPVVQLGGVDAGGGNSDVAEFYLIARAVASYYLSFNSYTELGERSSKLANVVRKLEVVGQEKQLQLGNQVVEAINYPDLQQVDLHLKSWNQRTLIKKIELVVHELLGLLRIPDPQFVLSWSIVLELQTYQPFMFGGDLAKIVQINHALRLTKVTCKIFRVPSVDHEPVKIFELQPVNSGLAETAGFGKGLIADVFFGYAPRPQIRMDIYTQRRPSDPPEAIGGKILASSVINVLGDALDASIQIPMWSVECSIPESSIPE